MKITFLLSCVFLSAMAVMAQEAVPNGNFENWDAIQFEVPEYYQSSNSEVLRSQLTFNAVKSANSYHGAASVKLTTVANAIDTSFGYIVNAQPDGDPSTWHGGVPYNQKPTGIRGYYKSNIPAGDTGLIILAFSNAGVNIGSYFVKIYGQHASYTLFDYTFNPPLSATPDSVIFGAVSSNALTDIAIPGSMLEIDSISLTGVTSQPSQLNGDFENWEMVIVETPLQWYPESHGEIADIKTTDFYKGQFGVKLETTLGDNQGIPTANTGFMATGYYPRNCSGNCNLQGGYPYTGQTDTLTFWYKYSANGNSKAAVGVVFKKNQNLIYGNQIELDAAATYQYAELPIYCGQVPDTLIVQIQSSRWQDSLITQVGSVLIIDEIQLKSQPITGLKDLTFSDQVKVYPNPVNDVVYMELPPEAVKMGITFRISNILGQTLRSIPVTQSPQAIPLEGLAHGVYTYTLHHHADILKSGKLMVK